jgi:hypothetical protein
MKECISYYIWVMGLGLLAGTGWPTAPPHPPKGSGSGLKSGWSPPPSASIFIFEFGELITLGVLANPKLIVNLSEAFPLRPSLTSLPPSVRHTTLLFVG